MTYSTKDKLSKEQLVQVAQAIEAHAFGQIVNTRIDKDDAWRKVPLVWKVANLEHEYKIEKDEEFNSVLENIEEGKK